MHHSLVKKLLFISLILTLASLVQAETTVKLEGVHNCCKSCTNGIIKAGVGLKDVSIVADGETVTITSKTKANAKKAVEAVLEAGYYGKPSDASFAEPARAKPEKKLTKATVTGAHLCCQKCVNAMTDAVKAVPGVTEYEIVSKEKTFTVKGEFTEADLIASMNKAGFHGSVK
jgi:copper chaperone CopZ